MLDPSKSRDERFERTLRAIDEARTLEALQRAARGLLDSYGLRHVVYHAIRIPSLDISQDVMLFTYPSDWVSHYVEKKYYAFDPVVRTAECGIVPIDWGALDKTAPAVKRLFDEANEAGLGRQGITVPIRGPEGDHAIFTVTSDASATEWGATRLSHMRDMQVLAHYVHGRILGLHRASAGDTIAVHLSPRERETLQWAAAGKTIEDTATILKISASSTRVYLDSARHKLGCLTKSHAVAKALHLGLISV